ncbi:hypothetical protein PT282_00645 [Bifidobacterium sp. ESL0763]|uniref:hypothetical protein n=1 Tax=Bifidobacterium sp. ESL0763 TaxID=2983227 RepID=UPI0023F84FC3|nr:hypothetical protein [Bifidobacterium sp. ESL0763]MDF7663191.1 hypothetical protein [Bifidobacterium sp. ESL0763]
MTRHNGISTRFGFKTKAAAFARRSRVRNAIWLSVMFALIVVVVFAAMKAMNSSTIIEVQGPSTVSAVYMESDSTVKQSAEVAPAMYTTPSADAVDEASVTLAV